MKDNISISPQRLAWLRQRLQRCEKRIIETAQWDTNYFYDGLLTDGQRNQLRNLFLNRMRILNEMFGYSDNEVLRLEELNTALTDATQQMYADFKNLYKGRLAMAGMEQYDAHAWLEVRMGFCYQGEKSVLKMPEDEYYGSQFDNMLELLCAEEDNLTYQGCVWSCKELTNTVQTADLDKDDDFRDVMDDGQSWALWMNHHKIEHINICHAVHDLFDHHLYSIPDMLRMNHFEVKIMLEQKRDFHVTMINCQEPKKSKNGVYRSKMV